MVEQDHRIPPKKLFHRCQRCNSTATHQPACQCTWPPWAFPFLVLNPLQCPSPPAPPAVRQIEAHATTMQVPVKSAPIPSNDVQLAKALALHQQDSSSIEAVLQRTDHQTQDIPLQESKPRAANLQPLSGRELLIYNRSKVQRTPPAPAIWSRTPHTMSRCHVRMQSCTSKGQRRQTLNPSSSASAVQLQ